METLKTEKRREYCREIMLLKTVEKKTECVNGLITSLKYTSWMVKNRGLGGGGGGEIKQVSQF